VTGAVPQRLDPTPATGEAYAFAGSADFAGYLAATRSAAAQAAFVRPHLWPGMTLLDCGCGPGSITVGLAALVAPAGVVGVRTRDWEGLLLSPAEPALLESVALWERLSWHTGGDPRRGKRLRALLHAAGFARAEVSASYDSHATPATTHQWATFWAAELRGTMGARLLARGWVDRASLDAMAVAWMAWANRPDAFLARAFCEAVAWRV
jgi:hypothetical protein